MSLLLRTCAGVAAVALAGLLGGCGDPPPEEAGATGSEPLPASATDAGSPTESLLPDSVFERWARGAFLSESATLDTVIAVFGRPDSLLSQPRANEYDPAQVDTVVVAVYDAGMRVEIYRVTGGGELIQSATIRAQSFLRGDAVTIGTPWENVLERFGPDDATVDGILHYTCGTCTDAGRLVTFEFEVTAGPVSAVVFTYYMG
jgi:hypothetical protein